MQDTIPTHTINLLACQAKEGKTDKKRSCFELITPNKTFQMSTDSKSESDSWLEAIKAAVTEYVGEVKAYEAPSGENIDLI